MPKRKSSVLLIAVLVFVPAMAAYAHHSFAATYQEDKKVTVEGKVVQLLILHIHDRRSVIHIAISGHWLIAGFIQRDRYS